MNLWSIQLFLLVSFLLFFCITQIIFLIVGVVIISHYLPGTQSDNCCIWGGGASLGLPKLMIKLDGVGKVLMMRVAELVGKLQSRHRKPEPTASTSGSAAPAGKSGKGGKKKRWGALCTEAHKQHSTNSFFTVSFVAPSAPHILVEKV